MIIRHKRGARVKSSADVIFREVEASKDADGNVCLQTIVDRARPKSAALHGEFTWDKNSAANKWNLHEARKLVQSIEIVHEDSKPTRAWESIVVSTPSTEPEEKPESKHVFRSVADILSDPVQRDELLAQALKDATAWRKRYAALQELAQIHAAIDAAIMNAKTAGTAGAA